MDILDFMDLSKEQKEKFRDHHSEVIKRFDFKMKERGYNMYTGYRDREITEWM